MNTVIFALSASFLAFQVAHATPEHDPEQPTTFASKRPLPGKQGQEPPRKMQLFMSTLSGEAEEDYHRRLLKMIEDVAGDPEANRVLILGLYTNLINGCSKSEDHESGATLAKAMLMEYIHDNLQFLRAQDYMTAAIIWSDHRTKPERAVEFFNIAVEGVPDAFDEKEGIFWGGTNSYESIIHSHLACEKYQEAIALYEAAVVKYEQTEGGGCAEDWYGIRFYEDDLYEGMARAYKAVGASEKVQVVRERQEDRLKN